MREWLEFAMKGLISTQLRIGETFDRMQHLIDNNLDELRKLREIYAQKSIDALHLLWNYFHDSNNLLMDAQVKDHKYFTDKMYDKVKQEYLSVMPVLCQYALAEFPDENSPSNLKLLSQRDLHIHHQRLRFNTMQKVASINMNIDRIQETVRVKARKKTLKQLWIIIEKCHKTIRKRYPGMWPDLPYEVDYVQYKNMYETTYCLLKYEIRTQTYPIVRVIPHIGRPSWRSFDNAMDIQPFAVNPVAWVHFKGLSDAMRNNKIYEGERRQLLITTFLAKQNEPVFLGGFYSDSDYEVEYNFDEAFEEEPLVFPMIE